MRMKVLFLALALLALTTPVRADSAACDRARQDALEPIANLVQGTMKLANATAGGCTDLKAAWQEYQKAHGASEAALRKVEIACGLPPAVKKSDQKPIEDLIRSCDEKK
jgi:hypothetical protein